MTEPRGCHPLTAEDTLEIWGLQEQEAADYLKDYTPFASETDLRTAVTDAEKDLFMALTWDQDLCGYFMLRGLDAGFDRPSFGVYVASPYAGRGLGDYALSQAESLCRDRGYPGVFLKVAEGNQGARRLYERHGFVAGGLCPDTGHVTMTLDLIS